MHYIIYKTTNLINGKFYIGKHQTKDLNDGYVGSGKLLKRAIAKYGINNFETIILHVYDKEWKMNVAEKILVVIDSEVSYNLCRGGKGGFDYINKNLNKTLIGKKGMFTTQNVLLKKYGEKNPAKIPSAKQKISNSMKRIYKNKKQEIYNAHIKELSNIDFSKYGWSKEVRKICKDSNPSRWLKKYFPQYYEIYKGIK